MVAVTLALAVKTPADVLLIVTVQVAVLPTKATAAPQVVFSVPGAGSTEGVIFAVVAAVAPFGV
jgi:hypothetical protein